MTEYICQSSLSYTLKMINFITYKLYLTKLIRERDTAGRKGGDKLPRETNAKGLGRHCGKRTCHSGKEWEGWACPHDLLGPGLIP